MALTESLNNWEILAILCATVGCLVGIKKMSQPPAGPLPPGPPRNFLLGNVLDMPKTQMWKAFAQWKQRWGDIISLEVFGQVIIIIQSMEVATDLLEKRSSYYSDRPDLTFSGDMIGWNDSLVLSHYGPRFRDYRKYIAQVIGTKSSMKRFLPLEERETQKFLARVAAHPERLAAEIRRTAGAIILMMSHGYEVKEGEDDLIELADLATEQFSQATRSGAYLVDTIPALRFVPGFLPGASFKKTAVEWRDTLRRMVDIPHQLVKDQMLAGTAAPSFTSELLSEGNVDETKEDIIKWAAQSLYSGGADTTVSAINTFYLAMTLYPEVAKKAQEELDAAVGTDRLPTFDDRENLPYLDALVKEVFRWNPVAPLGVPHRLMKDDVYKGYVFPAGTILMVNVWELLHDENTYKNPLEFDPSRHLGENRERDPRELCFGFGRRVCPGTVLADASVFISCAMSLAVFDISKKRDAAGKEIEPDLTYLDGTISHPTPFQCEVKPRSETAAALIAEVFS